MAALDGGDCIERRGERRRISELRGSHPDAGAWKQGPSQPSERAGGASGFRVRRGSLIGVLNWTIERVVESHLVNIDVRRSRLTSLPFPDRTADLVVAPLSLHHEPDLIAVLREVSRVLVPYGRFLLLDAVSTRGNAVLEVCGGHAISDRMMRDGLAKSGLDAVSQVALGRGWLFGRGGSESSFPLTFLEALKNTGSATIARIDEGGTLGT